MKIFRLLIIPVFLAFLVFAPQAAAKDQWIQVKSKNFLLIGNASEKDIRRVGTRLEQFRETFRQLFRNMKVTASIPTNVVVFKDEGAYKNFKPRRADGKADTEIAGYFQPGDDVNYITLSTGGDDKETFGTIFHEYVHFIIETNFGKSEIPTWFNEGLAEYYQTFEIADDIKVKLGLAQAGHLQLLQQSQFMPLADLFRISNYQLHQTGGHSRSIFYAESWALMHYLIQNGKSAELERFVRLLGDGAEQEAAFKEVFKTDYTAMESELRKYVTKQAYAYNVITFKTKLTFDTDMVTTLLDDGSASAYLGDLLYHTNRPDDAEPYLKTALAAAPNNSFAGATLGMVKIKQRKFDEAKELLERAIAADHQSHIALYRYAFLLSREARDEFGFVTRFEPATATKMRDALRKAIAINPQFGESYELWAFVNMMNGENLDEAISLLQTALKYQPGNQRYALRMAEVYGRQEKFDEASQMAEKIRRTSDDPEIRVRAADLISQVNQMKKIAEIREAEKKRYEAAANRTGGPPRGLVRRVEGVPPPSDAEIAKHQADARMRSLNEALRPVRDGEHRVFGSITKIDCRKRPIVFTIKTPTGPQAVTTKDFASMDLTSLDPDATQVQVGCETDLSRYSAAVTYADAALKGQPGEIVAVEFVPADFRLMTPDEMKAATLIIYDQEPPRRTADPVDTESKLAVELADRRRESMMQAIRGAIKQPAEGEKRDIGFLERIECTGKKPVFHLRTATSVIKLLNTDPKSMKITLFVPDMAGVEFGCGAMTIEYPAVFIYKDAPDAKTKTAGEIVSIDFVPRSFTLTP